MQPTAGRNSTIVDELGDFLVPNSNAEPLIVSGRGAEVVDVDGRTYVDLEAGPGVVSVGHCHPRVVKAVQEQAAKLMQSPSRYHSPLSLTLARRLADLIGNGVRRVFFANSGAEAADGAIKVALKHALATGKQGLGILAFEHGFHGRLSLALSLTGMASRKKGFGPYASFPGVVHVAAPYCFRCPLGLEPSSCKTACADTLETAMKTRVPGEAAIMIAEPILGVGGVIVPPDDYWPKVQAICERYKVTLIHDEVFTGFGRTGKAFAHQHWGTKPGMMTFAKAIGGGVPMAGFAATDEIVKPLDTGDHFTTFGSNNQIGLAAAHAVLDILNDERLSERAHDAGATFTSGLQAIARKSDAIGDVRGKGLMIGVELVADKKTRAPAPDLAKKVQKAMLDSGVLVAVTGVHACTLRITPPLVITDAQIDASLAALETALGTARKAA